MGIRVSDIINSSRAGDGEEGRRGVLELESGSGDE